MAGSPAPLVPRYSDFGSDTIGSIASPYGGVVMIDAKVVGGYGAAREVGGLGSTGGYDLVDGPTGKIYLGDEGGNGGDGGPAGPPLHRSERAIHSGPRGR